MKLSTLRGIIREEAKRVLTERRVGFNGKKVNQLYSIVKDEDTVLVFANGQYYSILDPEEMRNDLQNTETYVYTKDGDEVKIAVSDIEFLEIS
jgi:hypothetical protein